MRMSAALSHVTDIDEGMDLLSEYVKLIPGCTQFYLCLYSDWDSLSGHILELTDAEDEDAGDKNTILLKLAIRDGKRLPECSFPKRTLLPEFINKDSSAAYIVSPLFFENREFGYIAMAYEHNQISYHFQLVHWIMNVTQLLQNLCEIKVSRLMQTKLESIYMRDSLTGLYNRHGYEKRLPHLLYSLNDGDLLTAFLFDMDCLKVINDQFGHTEGDFALQVIGKAITNAFSDDAISTRFGGDEFAVAMEPKSEEEVTCFQEELRRFLAMHNAAMETPYTIHISIGCTRCTPEHTSIPALIQAADKVLYQAKAAGKQSRANLH